MKAEDFHQAMRPVNEACLLAKSGWICLSNPLVGWGEEGMIRWKIGILLRHIALVFRCFKKASFPHILIREFSSVPLLLVFPFLLPLRKKLFFMVHQNIQWAAQRKSEKIALLLLSKLGARWAILETQEFSGFEKFNIPSEKNLVLPHPCDAMRLKSGRASLSQGLSKLRSERAVIGVAGYYRAEKGMDELVCLLRKTFPEFGILLGVPNPEAVKHLDVETIDTSTDEAYREMISRCDVLVFNHRPEGYFYRASGPVADAAACGTAVVTPDFPILGKQVAGIGETFHPLTAPTKAPKRARRSRSTYENLRQLGGRRPPGGDDLDFCRANQPLETGSAGLSLPAAVRRAIEKARNVEYDFETYCAARSARAIAKQLDEFHIEKSKKTKEGLAATQM